MAVSTSLPVDSDPAGMLIVKLPPTNVVVAEVYPPPASVTEPVGVGEPFTAIVTDSVCAVVMLVDDGVTDTVGVVFTGLVTVMVDDPVAALYVEALFESGV